MQSFSLQKAQSIIKFWEEITLPYEAREKRMREKADKAAQEFHERLFSGKLNKDQFRIDEETNKEVMPKGRKADPSSLDRFLNLGLVPEMLNRPNATQPQPPKGENNV